MLLGKSTEQSRGRQCPSVELLGGRNDTFIVVGRNVGHAMEVPWTCHRVDKGIPRSSNMTCINEIPRHIPCVSICWCLCITFLFCRSSNNVRLACVSLPIRKSPLIPTLGNITSTESNLIKMDPKDKKLTSFDGTGNVVEFVKKVNLHSALKGYDGEKRLKF